MKKACFIVGIGLFYLTLVLTILVSKSVAQEFDSCKGFLGYAADNIAVFNNYSTAYQCTLNLNNCDKVRILSQFKDKEGHYLCWSLSPATFDGTSYCNLDKLLKYTDCIYLAASPTPILQSSPSPSASPTTYHVSQLQIQDKCLGVFGSDFYNVPEVSKCITDAYKQCVNPKFTDKKLEDDPTLTQEPFNTATACINNYIDIAKKKLATQPAASPSTKPAPKKITKWELYWENPPNTQLVASQRGGNISFSGEVHLPDPSTLPNREVINGRISYGYGMTLYVYFNGYSGACYDDSDPKDCKKTSFTVRYTAPQASIKSGFTTSCIPGTPEFMVGSCTGRCKTANCPNNQGEGSYHVCKADGRSYEEKTFGACYVECGTICYQDKDVDVSKSPDCSYDEPCQKDGKNGTRTCSGKSINNQCMHTPGCDTECKVPKESIICTPGAYKVDCTQKCNCGKDSGTGEATVKQCNSNGTAWEPRNPECNSQCAQYCGGATGPKEGSACTYPEQCPGGGVHTCTGTIQGGICKYNPAIDPACTVCR